MSGVLFHRGHAVRVLERNGVSKLLKAQRKNPLLPQLRGFSVPVASHLTPHQLDILDVDVIMNLLTGTNCPHDFTWRSAVMLNDNESKKLFGRSVDALITSNYSATSYVHMQR